MQPKTIATLADLEKAEWFANVGRKDTGPQIVVLDSWDVALTSGVSEEWRELCLEATNQYCERLVERNRDRFNDWNKIVAEVKKLTEPLVQRKTAEVMAENRFPKAFVNVVRWDMLHVCMEAEYADIYPPGFYGAQAYWYVVGHFPCGWQGKFPEGKRVVY